MKSTSFFYALVSSTWAFPVMDDPETAQIARDLLRHYQPRDLSQDPLGISRAQTNCGPTPCTTFDAADQLVSVTGQNAYQSPAASDIRGPCPGLNAAANHGYLPRNGIATIEQTVSGLQALHNMQPALATALSEYAIATDGNVLEEVWSIGGPLPADYLVEGLLGTGQGFSYSHNAYEGDASIGRNDAYTNAGDAHSLNITKFERVYALGGTEDRYTLDKFRARFEAVQDESIANNPYYFTGAFSTVVVEEPSDYLDGYNFKSFFGVTGEPGNFTWIRGQERVPEQWYRRPTSDQNTAPDVFVDVGIGYAAYPNTLKFGGNTGTPNSFVGLDVANLTGGVYNAADLFNGDNLACFSYNILQEGIPDFLSDILNDITPVTSFINKYVGPIVGGLNCTQIEGQSTGLFNDFPGYKYSPSGPDTNY
ncbi:Aromatic peroxygenase [Lachnellula suecica]|uniref:Aromatic peroxygenase n=1 Tax=Lachnellula suecica TaxID=602035 RepID=A0A8T9C016_9HELO|nr:Aromatic peroxygenase [Lachnellula suecica]